jgi:hypothetical protein
MEKIKINPFLDRYDHPMIGSDRHTEVSNVYQVILSSSASFQKFESSQPKIIIVKAGYGIGKTFTAFHVKNKVLSEDDFAVSSFKLIDDQQAGVNTSNKNFVEKVILKLEVNSKQKEEIENSKNSWINKNKKADDFSSIFGLSQELYEKQIKNLVVLIDEVEDLLSSGVKKTISYLTMIRNLYDTYIEQYSSGKKATPFAIVLFLSPEAWDVVIMQGEARNRKLAGAGLSPLISRIGSNIFTLREFDKTDTYSFISMCLNYVRETASDDTEPFTKDVVNNIFLVTRGNPRRILSYCYDLMDIYIRNDLTSISMEDFKAYCKQKNIDIPTTADSTPTEEDSESFYGDF